MCLEHSRIQIEGVLPNIPSGIRYTSEAGQARMHKKSERHRRDAVRKASFS
jgi:hypothetical protein